jgi:hypothetical protein
VEQSKEILLAQPRGFCAGVDRAIEIANAQHDTILEGHGLLTAWTVYTADDGRFMAEWRPEGYVTPAGTVLSSIVPL